MSYALDLSNNISKHSEMLGIFNILQRNAKRDISPMHVFSTEKTLTTSNIKNGFWACGIWLLNYDAMNGKIRVAIFLSLKFQ